MTLSTLSPLPTAPARTDMENFDTRADAFLTAMKTLSDQLVGWIAEFNAEGATYDAKFFSGDSRLTALESETLAARDGADSLKDRIDAVVSRVDNLVTLQQVLSLGQISVAMSRRPTPDDDGYLVGTYWVYPAADDYWFCVGALSQRARWRRSNGDLIRRLEAPTVTGDTSVGTLVDLTLTLTGLDPEATEVQWTVTGSPTVVSGSLSGSLATSITFSWADVGNYTIRAQVIGDGDQLLYDSLYSSALPVVVGPSIYCGCGAYCGDGSYPGIMLA